MGLATWQVIAVEVGSSPCSSCGLGANPCVVRRSRGLAPRVSHLGFQVILQCVGPGVNQGPAGDRLDEFSLCRIGSDGPKPLDSKPINSIITKAGRATHALDRHTWPCNIAQGKAWASGLFVRAYTSISQRDARRRSGLQRSNRATSKTSTSSARDAMPERRSRIMSSTCEG